jgi:tetratricopeptide (TPR) repeat protein
VRRGIDQDGLLRLAVADPQRARAAARELLAVADDPADRIVVLRALGLSAKELGRLEESLRCLFDALAAADAAGLAYAAAQVRMNLCGPLAADGDIDAALAAADAAAPVLRGGDVERLAANRACVLARSGRITEAFAIVRDVLPALRSGDDAVTLAGLLTNLGLLRAFHGDLTGAQAHLGEAAGVADRAGLRHQAALARGNLAFVAARRGDFPRALALHDAVEPELAGAGERHAQLRFDRAETLIAAGLAAEARPLLTATLAEVTAAGYDSDAADGLLLLACAELADDDPVRAAATASRAAAAFGRQERPGWMLLAEHIRLCADWAAGDHTAALFRTAVVTADRLDRGGWREAAANSRIIAARLALRLGLPAGNLASRLGVSRERGPAGLRVAAWHATALDRASRHDRRAAMAAVRAGLRVAEMHAAAVGAMELRSHAARLGNELAALGLRLARTGRELLAAEERWRALALCPPAVRPPADPAHAAVLAELRRVSHEHTYATAAGADTTGLAARLVRLEADVRDCARTRPGIGLARSGRESRTVSRLYGALGGRAFVELIRVGRDLHSVVVVGGRCHRRDLGSYDAAVHGARLLGFELGRLAADALHEAALTGLEHAAAGLDSQIFGPLRRLLGDRELVLAPADALHGLAWTALPSLAGRPVTVVGSAATWLSRTDTLRDGRTVLVAGPGPAHAPAEVADLAGCHPGATVLRGAAARADAVRDALDGAGLAHLAAHGTFRDGNALLSSVSLADGPLMAYDLEMLRRPPRLVVLSACDAGRAGAALMGLPGVLLRFGTATVIASVAPVGDGAARDFMVAVHRQLARGVSPARALAAVPRTPGVLGFVCFGAG